jgi:hypothetical protein
MAKSWPFMKVKDDGENISSQDRKKTRRRRYVRVEFVRRMWEEKRPVPWSDASLPGGGWYLNSRRVSVPLVLLEGREQHEVVRRLPPDMRDDLAFAVVLYNWITFGT